MSKLHRRGHLAISTIVAASALLALAPAGASAAEASGDGSTSGETVVEPPGNSSQPAAPPTTEWTPQDAEGASGGGAAPLEHGSSVGSGAVTGKTGSSSEKPSSTHASSGSYEPEPSTPPPTLDEPASTPRTGGGIHTAQPAVAAVQPTAAAKPSRVVEVAVGAATSLGHPASFQRDRPSFVLPVAAATRGDSGDRASTSSFALPLLVIVVLCLIFGFAGVRLRRQRRRRRLEALWREQDAEWEAALRRCKLEQASEGLQSSAQPLQRIGVG
jgi:hypothetical protein